MAWSCSQFSEASDNSELRRSCDEVLARFREESHETAHSTPGISLLADGKCAERMSVRLSPIVDFASSSRVCPLLRALASHDATNAPLLQGVMHYHEQTKRDWASRRVSSEDEL